MKKSILVMFLLFVSATVHAGQEGAGFGVILGQPNGLSYKKWISDRYAFDAAIAWSFLDNASVQLHADYLIHPFDINKPKEIKGRLLFYYGIGGTLALVDSVGNGGSAFLGMRVPIGISLLFTKTPAELFGEIVPLLAIAPQSDVYLNAAIGARYYFK